jgi:DNA-binding NarL/FixJ family response regulator
MAERVAADRVEAALREQLTQEDMAAAYREGRALAFDEVIALALTLLDELTQASPHADMAPNSPLAMERIMQRTDQNPLSARELEVLRLVAQGLSSKAIGRRLSLSPSTVNHHIQSIFNKLDVDTRAQAVAAAAQRQLL